MTRTGWRRALRTYSGAGGFASVVPTLTLIAVLLTLLIADHRPARGSASSPQSAATCVTPALPASTPSETDDGAGWVGAWGTAGQRLPNHPVHDRTLRQLVHPTVGGGALRIRIANTFSATALRIEGASIAVSESSSSPRLRPGTSKPLTFKGHQGIGIPSGTQAISSAVTFPVRYGETLAIDLWVGQGGTETGHARAVQTSYSAAGDHTGESAPAAFTERSEAWYWLDGVDVLAGPGAESIAVLGDSLTDGTRTTMNADRRWPDVLAARLHHEPDPRRPPIGILNAGIGGNRVTRDNLVCVSPSASGIRRLDQDVLSRNDTRILIVADGINDIDAGVRAPTLIAGLRSIARRAHRHGLSVVAATITPFGCDTGCLSTHQEAARQSVNRWIRTSAIFDAVIDFDAAVRDPSDPRRLRPGYDYGDRLHLNDAGTAALAEAINLRQPVFGPGRPTSGNWPRR